MKKKRMIVIAVLLGLVLIISVVGGCSKSTEPDNELTAPSNLTVSIVNGVIIQLEWIDNCSNEEGYKIERRSENGQFEIIADLNENVTMYLDYDIDYNEIYTYRVFAYSQNNQSEYSNEAYSEITYNGFKVLASDGDEQDSFGDNVAIDGDYAVIGALGDDDNGDRSGSAYIFHREGAIWIEQEKLLASNGGFSDHFGSSVAIDGDYVFIGASGYADLVYIFRREDTSWEQEQIISASDSQEHSAFGGSLSVCGDYMIVGAMKDDNNNMYERGAAYVFHKEGNTWIEQQKLTASNGSDNDWFGRKVSICSNYAFVSTSSSVYIYRKDNNIWVEIQEISSSYSSISVSDDYCFISSSDGTIILALENSVWIEQDVLSYGGSSVSIQESFAVVGHTQQFSAGSAKLFERVGTNWVEHSSFIRPDAEGGDDFGCSVSIKGDYAVIGASGDDDNGNYSGSAYIYTLQERYNSPAINKKTVQLPKVQNEISLK